MKAIRVNTFGDPEIMQLEEVPDPKPQAGQVVVRVHAAGVNPVDTYVRAGGYALEPDLPYTPGMDAAGEVESVGDGVSRVKAGDRVYVAGTLSGSYAEKTLCREAQVWHLPERISFAQGAGVNVPCATAYRALFQSVSTKPGETLVVHGASGGVGIAAVQLARAAGIRVIGTAGTPEGRRLVSDQGAHHVLDHHESKHWDQIMDLTGGAGADVILEMLANVNLARDLEVLAYKGRAVVIGCRGEIEINPRLTMGKETSIVGMTLLRASAEDLVGIHSALVAAMEAGILTPIVGKEMPLTDAPRAHHEVIESSAYGKIVLIP